MHRFVPKICLRALLCALLCACGGTHAAEESSYNADLATLYNEYQRLLAVRDACVAAQPARRNEVASAYQDWLERHQRIVDDLDNRFAAIVKRASRNQAEFTRNYGKYQAEVHQMREENKKALLADKEKLARQCGEFVTYVRHPKSDLPTLFPSQFKNVYRVR